MKELNSTVSGSLLLFMGLFTLFMASAGAQQSAREIQPNRAERLLEVLKTGQVKLNVREMSLSDITAHLASQLHCNILVDDEPLLTKADVQFEGNGKEALDKVADVFDYTWQASKSGGVLLRKRFRNPLEHPQLNYPEMKQMAHDAVTVLSALHFDPRNPDERWEFTLHSFWDALTPMQLQVLNDGQKLTMPQLSGTQRSLVETTIYTGVFGSLYKGWLNLDEQLAGMPRGYIKLQAIPGRFTVQGQAKPVNISLLSYEYLKRASIGGLLLNTMYSPSKEERK